MYIVTIERNGENTAILHMAVVTIGNLPAAEHNIIN